ncbi:hypothetical protein Y032_0584g312 [Ancylostoma ceylanicum]|uniref:Uncharacterized protein n=1 Tax=Ancylostoma ceylanicum TaxID=53326 RepID=A0A016WN55_9BILA|nr:hypothetical protein Y032_0584g312 [Ancylostoma ceylanicum]
MVQTRNQSIFLRRTVHVYVILRRAKILVPTVIEPRTMQMVYIDVFRGEFQDNRLNNLEHVISERYLLTAHIFTHCKKWPQRGPNP